MKTTLKFESAKKMKKYFKNKGLSTLSVIKVNGENVGVYLELTNNCLSSYSVSQQGNVFYYPPYSIELNDEL